MEDGETPEFTSGDANMLFGDPPSIQESCFQSSVMLSPEQQQASTIANNTTCPEDKQEDDRTVLDIQDILSQRQQSERTVSEPLA